MNGTLIPKIGLIVVGDEILSGLRTDGHMPAVIEKLNKRGLSLSWVQFAGDDRPSLVELYRRTFATSDIVLSCGGIGGTPDDHTRQAAAEAIGRPLHRHPQACELIRERCMESGQPVDEYRLRMADFPTGCELIPNPFNKIAGFSVDRHHFVPGFPVMAWPMIDWVLDTLYPHLHHLSVEHKRALRLYGVAEARITPIMETLEATFPGCRLYSLPHVGDNKLARHIELGVKVKGQDGEQTLLETAFQALLKALPETGGRFELLS